MKSELTPITGRVGCPISPSLDLLPRRPPLLAELSIGKSDLIWIPTWVGVSVPTARSVSRVCGNVSRGPHNYKRNHPTKTASGSNEPDAV